MSPLLSLCDDELLYLFKFSEHNTLLTLRSTNKHLYNQCQQYFKEHNQIISEGSHLIVIGGYFRTHDETNLFKQFVGHVVPILEPLVPEGEKITHEMILERFFDQPYMSVCDNEEEAVKNQSFQCVNYWDNDIVLMKPTRCTSSATYHVKVKRDVLLTKKQAERRMYRTNRELYEIISYIHPKTLKKVHVNSSCTIM